MGLFGSFIEDEVLNEDKSIEKSIYNLLENEMVHILKFIHQPNRQSVSWINSIFNSSNMINKKFVKSIHIENSDLDKIYLRASKEASRQTGINISKIQPTRPIEFTFKNLTNKEWLYNYLYSIAYSDEIRNMLDKAIKTK